MHAMAGIRPPFGEGDLDRFLWADSGALRNGPIPTSSARRRGDLRLGGGDHHVSIIDHVEGDMYVCIGANQSHTVKAVDVPQGSSARIRNQQT